MIWNEPGQVHALLDMRKCRLTARRARQGLDLKEWAILYISAGEGQLHIAQNGQKQALPLHNGALFVLSPYSRIHATCAPAHPSLRLILLRIASFPLHRVPAVQQLVKDETQGVHMPQTAIKVDNQARLLSLLNDIYAALRTDRATAVAVQLHFLELLQMLKQAAEQHPRNNHEAVQQTIRYIQSNPIAALSAGELPQMAGMTASAYCKVFKKITGRTPNQYLTDLRIREAKKLLEMEGAHTRLKEIAQSVGYQDEFYFSRVFKKAEGLAPTVYKKRRHSRIAVVSHLLLQDHLLAFGITPVGAPSSPSVYRTSSGFPPYLHPRLQQTQPINVEQTVQLDDVQKLSPDYVIKMNFFQNPNDSAWTKAGNVVYFDGFYQWHEYLRAFGDLLHRREEAEQMIVQMNRHESAGRDALRAFTRKGGWAIIRVLPHDVRIYGVTDHALSDLFYDKLGFEPDPHITHGFYKKNGLPDLLNWDPENIFIIWSDPAAVQRIGNNPHWQQLRAVRQKRVFFPQSRLWDPWGPSGRTRTIQVCVDYFGSHAPL